MVPFRDNGHLTNKQKNYNFCHSSARMAIERAFALLKGRFRSLLTVLDMDRVDLIPDFIMACCILHNICFLKNDDFTITEPNVFETVSDSNRQFTNERCNNAAQLKRDRISNNLTIRHV